MRSSRRRQTKTTRKTALSRHAKSTKHQTSRQFAHAALITQTGSMPTHAIGSYALTAPSLRASFNCVGRSVATGAAQVTLTVSMTLLKLSICAPTHTYGRQTISPTRRVTSQLITQLNCPAVLKLTVLTCNRA